MKKTMFAALCVSALAVTASAQQELTYTFERKVPPGEQQKIEIEKMKAEQAWKLALETGKEGQQAVLDKVKAEQAWKVALETKAVVNAPYSAEAINESVQTLPDGNRIVNRSSSRVYRDSAGRVRRETLDANGDVLMTSISDPTTGSSTVFSPRTNAISRSVVTVRSTGEGGTATASGTAGSSAVWVTTDDKVKAEIAAPNPPEGRERIREGVAVGGATFFWAGEGAPAKGEATKDDLGQQTIEGVTAKGTRTTTTIPAGSIGNEQPIKIVSEEWFSPELQALVLTRHSDPRTGETTYRLTGIVRTEPPASLFEMPAKK
jgi:hypothetical protein